MGFFPFRVRSDTVNGPLEVIAMAGGAFIGGCIGWEFGSKLMEYANQAVQSADSLAMVLRNYEIITRLLPTVAVASFVGKVSRCCGRVADILFGSYHKDNPYSKLQ